MKIIILFLSGTARCLYFEYTLAQKNALFYISFAVILCSSCL